MSTGTETLQRLLWIMAALAAATLPHVTHLPPWIPLLLGACMLWRTGMSTHRLWVPPAWLRIVLATGCFGLVYVTYGTINGLRPGSALLVVMMALKLLETRRRRDYVVLLLIAYFLIFAGLLRWQSPVVGGYLLAVAWLTTAALLQATRDTAPLAPAAVLGLSGRLIAGAIPVMVILFLLFPRVPGPLWGSGLDDASAVSGLSDRMSPGDITELGLSDEIAFRARFDERPPPARDLYWRALVLDDFDGRSWTASERTRQRPGRVEQLEALGEPVHYEVVMEPHRQRWVFALERPGESTMPGVTRAADLRMTVPRPINDRTSIALTSWPEARVDVNAPRGDVDDYLRLDPRSNPRSRAFAAELRARHAEDDAAVIDALLRHFNREEFHYTLLPAALGEHPVDDFLFATREGFCEHFASAFAAVMRAAGIPTRVVLGYQGGELNPVGNYLVIRQSDAHAWNEVWLDGRGWVRIDPVAAVAPERVSLGIHGALGERDPLPGRALRERPMLYRAAQLWDAANTWWNDAIIGYDQASQRDWLSRLGMERRPLTALVAMLAIALAVTMIVLAAVLVRNLAPRERDRVQRAWQRLGRRLGAAGLARAPGESPADWARRVGAARPELAGAMHALAGLYLRLRYEPSPRAADIDRFDRATRRMHVPRRAGENGR